MSSENATQYGQVTASYFWDDGSGVNGDTGQPASGEPMQEGLAASPSWPLGTEGYVMHDGKKADFFVGDRGPGDPAEGCNVLLDLDGETFAELTGGDWNPDSLTVSGGEGHIDVEYVITKWGDGAGTEGAPRPMGSGEECTDAVSPVPDDIAGGDGDDGGGSGDGGGKKEAKDAKDGDSGSKDSAGTGSKGGEQSAAASGGQDGGGPSGHEGTHASTAANDMSALNLAAADAPVAAGALALALIPALLIALLFARRDLVVDWVGADRTAAWGERASALRERGAALYATAAERVRATAGEAAAAIRNRSGRSF